MSGADTERRIRKVLTMRGKMEVEGRRVKEWLCSVFALIKFLAGAHIVIDIRSREKNRS